jgi:hypothetical protein|tara:strand:+ start:669 stop:920 length:252 start_codon:yes stop_codon:yes gene_type:complete
MKINDIVQIISELPTTPFPLLGLVADINESYITLIPFEDEKLEEKHGASIPYKTEIPVKRIHLTIVVKEHDRKENNKEQEIAN